MKKLTAKQKAALKEFDELLNPKKYTSDKKSGSAEENTKKSKATKITEEKVADQNFDKNDKKNDKMEDNSSGSKKGIFKRMKEAVDS